MGAAEFRGRGKCPQQGAKVQYVNRPGSPKDAGGGGYGYGGGGGYGGGRPGRHAAQEWSCDGCCRKEAGTLRRQTREERQPDEWKSVQDEGRHDNWHGRHDKWRDCYPSWESVQDDD